MRMIFLFALVVMLSATTNAQITVNYSTSPVVLPDVNLIDGYNGTIDNLHGILSENDVIRQDKHVSNLISFISTDVTNNVSLTELESLLLPTQANYDYWREQYLASTVDKEGGNQTLIYGILKNIEANL